VTVTRKIALEFQAFDINRNFSLGLGVQIKWRSLSTKTCEYKNIGICKHKNMGTQKIPIPSQKCYQAGTLRHGFWKSGRGRSPWKAGT
jgi:hypothetical protein